MAKNIINDNQRAFLKFCKQSFDDNNELVVSQLEKITGLTREDEIIKSCRDAIRDYDENVVIQLNRTNKAMDILVLNGKIKEAYKALGDNPLDVPELLIDNTDELMDDIDKFYDGVFKVTGIDPDKETKDYPEEYSLDYLDSFVVKCVRKVNSLKDEAGYYKKTDAIKDAKVITFSKRRELMKIRKPIEELEEKKIKKITAIKFPKETTLESMDGYNESIDEIVDWFDKEKKPLEGKWINAVYKATEIKKGTLTKWEEKLLEKGYVLSYIYKEVNTPS